MGAGNATEEQKGRDAKSMIASAAKAWKIRWARNPKLPRAKLFADRRSRLCHDMARPTGRQVPRVDKRQSLCLQKRKRRRLSETANARARDGENRARWSQATDAWSWDGVVVVLVVLVEEEVVKVVMTKQSLRPVVNRMEETEIIGENGRGGNLLAARLELTGSE